MIRHCPYLIGGLACLLAGGPAAAQTLFVANLTHSQETTQGTFTTSTGAPRPVSFGSATFVLNAAQTELTFSAIVYNIDFNGLQTTDINDNLTNAHIHAGATAVPGQNAGVVFGFFGAPFNDNNPNDAIVTPFTTGVGGTVTSKWDLNEGNNTTLTAQIPNLLAGLSYINFHTRQFGGGEIRGALQVVPEPSAVAFLCAGALGIAGLRLKRGRKQR